MNNQISPVSKINDLMRSDTAKERFADIVGDHQTGAYISSVMLAVANSEKLQQCTPQSVYISAIRAATLHLSVDPGLGHAYLVPFKGKATLIIGYKGLYDLALRTNKYRYINVGKVFEGEEVIEDRITGFHSLSGSRTGSKVIGWIGAFEMLNGYGKTLYMTIEEIHAHAKKYSSGYNLPDGSWNKDPEMMERKTILRVLLTKWGQLEPTIKSALVEVEGPVDEEEKVEPYEIVDGVIQDGTKEKMAELHGKNQVAPSLFEDKPEDPEPEDVPF